MGTMRGNFIESFMFLSLWASGQAEISLHGSKVDTIPSVWGDSSSSSLSNPSPDMRRSCIYTLPDLPPCDFETSVSERSNGHFGLNRRRIAKSIKKVDRNHHISLEKKYEENLKTVNRGSTRELLTVYTIEGCIPLRLPFNIPFCNDEDFITKTVVVQKLYPFKVPGISAASAVFPEFNFNNWMDMMSQLRISHDPSATNNRQIVLAKPSNKKAKTYTATGSPSNGFARPSEEKRGADDRSPDSSNIETIDELPPLIDDGVPASYPKPKPKTRRSEEATAKTEAEYSGPESTRHRGGGSVRGTLRSLRGHDRLSNAILHGIGEPGDSELFDLSPNELALAEAERESFLPRDEFDVPRTQREVSRGSEFPYSKAIPFDPKKLEGANRWGKVVVNARSTLPLETRKSRAVKMGSEFPYWKAIPYDPKRLAATRQDGRTWNTVSRATRDVLGKRSFAGNDVGATNRRRSRPGRMMARRDARSKGV